VVAEDLYVATELNFMEALASTDEGQALFYVGHSGWGPGQLETELAEGSWLVLPATSQHVFGDHDTFALWKETMTEVGRRQIHSVVPIKHVPDNPRAN
jgi:putative transcriptional regulator